MNPIFRIMCNFLLYGFLGVCSLCSIAMASDTSKPVKLNLASVVYSKSNMNSNNIIILDRSAVYYVQVELDNASGRWCGINDSKDVFIGYTLCNNLKTLTKYTPKHKRTQSHIITLKSDQPSKSVVSDNTNNISRSVLAETSPTIFHNISVNAPVTYKHISSVTYTTDSTSGMIKPIISLIFISVFLLTLLIAYSVYNYRLDKTTKETITDDNIIYEDNNSITTPEEAKVVQSDVAKATSSSVSKLVTCQVCGTIQTLSDDSKCINCRATITN